VRRPGSDLARDELTFRLGTARIDRFGMPDLRNRTWSITAAFPLDAGPLPEGVLVAGGDRTSGYSLYLQDGAVHFAFNYLGEIRTVSATVAGTDLAGSSLELTVRFTKTAPYEGTVTVEVAGVAGGTGPIRMLPFRQTMSGLHIGSDPGSTVTDAYTAPFRFGGTGLVVRYQMLDDRDDLQRVAEVEARNALAEQ
jgi:arylsulfatase